MDSEGIHGENKLNVLQTKKMKLRDFLAHIRFFPTSLCRICFKDGKTVVIVPCMLFGPATLAYTEHRCPARHKIVGRWYLPGRALHGALPPTAFKEICQKTGSSSIFYYLYFIILYIRILLVMLRSRPNETKQIRKQTKANKRLRRTYLYTKGDYTRFIDLCRSAQKY